MPKEALSSSSDANDFLVETFFMYSAWPPKDTCECAVPRDTWLTCLSQGRRNNSTPCCALCGDEKKKVVTVLDGYMHSCLLHGSSPELQSRFGAGLMKEQGRTPLAFKHGAIAYQVGLPLQRPNSSSHGGSWLTSSMKKDTAEYYAQDHIAHVLGLERAEMKVRSSRAALARVLQSNKTRCNCLHSLMAHCDCFLCYCNSTRFCAKAKSCILRQPQQASRKFRIDSYTNQYRSRQQPRHHVCSSWGLLMHNN